MTGSAGAPTKPGLRRRAVLLYIRGRRAVEGLVFERRYRVHTTGIVHLEELGLDHPERLHYEPSEWRTLRRILRDDEVAPSDVFLDFGSGMGRMVLEAARYPFKRVIGVELAEQLNGVARRNVESNRVRLRCEQIELVTSDAASFDIPDDVSVVYMGNPFQGNTFRAVIQRLLESVDRSPRRLRMIYFEPVERETLDATGRFRLIRRGRGVLRWWRTLDTLLMYDVLPRPGGH
jgi:16S rRNA G966 N2-methylase RsmD